MLEMVYFKDYMDAFARGRKSRRKARWKKKMSRYLGKRFMIIIF